MLSIKALTTPPPSHHHYLSHHVSHLDNSRNLLPEILPPFLHFLGVFQLSRFKRKIISWCKPFESLANALEMKGEKVTMAHKPLRGSASPTFIILSIPLFPCLINLWYMWIFHKFIECANFFPVSLWQKSHA
jgi:hypothetical protein